jgi:hypothetical protein
MYYGFSRMWLKIGDCINFVHPTDLIFFMTSRRERNSTSQRTFTDVIQKGLYFENRELVSVRIVR